MSTILKVGPYRFFFYSGDGDEPRHIHIERDDKLAKFWIDPIRFQNSSGFSSKEIDKIQKLVKEHQNLLIEGWDEYFNG